MDDHQERELRAEFEAAVNAARFFPREIDFTICKSPSGKRDEYVNRSLQATWEGYQLARRSSPSTQRQGEDTARIDWLGKKLTGASDSERYLPFRVYWGAGGDIRKAIDKARAHPANAPEVGK